jgi:hypothetical protein
MLTSVATRKSERLLGLPGSGHSGLGGQRRPLIGGEDEMSHLAHGCGLPNFPPWMRPRTLARRATFQVSTSSRVLVRIKLSRVATLERSFLFTRLFR